MSDEIPLRRSGARFLCGLGERVVGLVNFKGRIYVATESGLFRLEDDDRLHPIEFVTEEKS